MYTIAIQESSLAVGVSSIKLRLLHKTKEAQWLLFLLITAESNLYVYIQLGIFISCCFYSSSPPCSRDRLYTHEYNQL